MSPKYVASCCISVVVWTLPLNAVAAHDVPAHAAMTERAAERSQGFQAFLELPLLGDEDYADTAFATTTKAEWDAFKSTSRLEGKLYWRGFGPKGMLVAGAVLEDSTSRFLHHFYNPHAPEGFAGLNVKYELGITPSTALYLPAPVYALLTTPFTSAPEWLSDSSNEYSLNRAIEDYYQSVSLPKEDARREAIAHMFCSIGHSVHLLQDMSQPGHTRNDAHGGSYLKQALPSLPSAWLFRLGGKGSALESWETRHLTQVQWDLEADDIFAPTYFPEARLYLDDLARFSADKWFSDDTAMHSGFQEPTAWMGVPGPGYVESPGSLIEGGEEFVGSIPSGWSGQCCTKLARALPGAVLPGGAWSPSNYLYDLVSSDESLAKENATILVNKGIAQSEALLDHFFRGSLKVECDPELVPGVDLRVTNLSSEGGVGLPLSHGTWEFFYTSHDGTVQPLTQYLFLPVQPDLASNGVFMPVSVSAPSSGKSDLPLVLGSLSNPSLPASQRVDSHSKLLVVFRGDIGVEQGIAVGVTTPRRAYSPYSLSPPQAQAFAGAQGGDTWLGPYSVPGYPDDFPVSQSTGLYVALMGTDDLLSKVVCQWTYGCFEAFGGVPLDYDCVFGTEAGQFFWAGDSILHGALSIAGKVVATEQQNASGTAELIAEVAGMPVGSPILVAIQLAGISSSGVPPRVLDEYKMCGNKIWQASASAQLTIAYGTVQE